MRIRQHKPIVMSLPRSSRIESIDILRGIIMVIMAIDHVRDFFSITRFDPTDLSQASPGWFLTRWITHFCAPNFIFLSGISISLYASKVASKKSVSVFLLSRGFWLIVVELVVLSYLLVWNRQTVIFQVIWAIGFSMILMSALVWLPRSVQAAVAFVLIVFHQILPQAEPVTGATLFGSMLHHTPFFFPSTPGMFVIYSVVPWVGVMLAGYLVGSWFQEPESQYRPKLLMAGAALLIVFTAIRLLNIYGDPSPWSVQDRGILFTVFSFVNVSKYPPSLLFICLTVGVGLIGLATLGRFRGTVARFFQTFGSVPFFYYILHFAFIAVGSFLWTYSSFGEGFNLALGNPADFPVAYQPSLIRLYLVWIIIVALLYYPCKLFSEYRRQHRQWWLSYL